MGFYFISAPANPTKQETISKLSSAALKTATLYPFSLPEFKVGTLDSLILLSDDLTKADASLEAQTLKISDNLKTLLNNDIQAWTNSLSINDKNIQSFLKTFSWNSMKYRTDKTLRELMDILLSSSSSIEALMKTKTTAYSQATALLNSIQRKNIGNLSVKSLNDIVKKEYFVLDSEYLTTLLVAVPKNLTKEWIQNYETLTQMVVPRSSQLIAQDEEFCLYNVTLFKRIANEFTQKAREQKFLVREFTWDAEQLVLDKKQASEAYGAEREQWTTLVRLSKTNFGEVYSIWMHIKCLRLFVESILRYGLPPNFQPMVLEALPKQEGKIRDMLNTHFSYLEGKAGGHDPIDDALVHLVEKDYSAAVMFSINSLV